MNTAVALGAKYVSNSYGADSDGPADPARPPRDAYYNHPGIAVVAAPATTATASSYPAASPYVTAVGGTTLTRDRGRPAAGRETGLGRRRLRLLRRTSPSRPSSSDTGCANRTVADVSAVADPATGVAVYDSTYQAPPAGTSYGGTSASAPIIAGVYALAGDPAAGTNPTLPLPRPPRCTT